MHNTQNGGGRRFVLGVFFLTMSNLLTKICGLFLKVPLTNTLGDTGMAYFNLAYAVYKWFYMISTAGLPVAAAILTARYASEPDPVYRAAVLRRIRNVTFCAFLVLGAVGGLCMYVGAPLFAALQKVGEAAPSIAAIAPALFFICIASALRGWYQGLECQLPTAISQVAEAGGKMFFGLLFAAQAMRRGLPLCTVAAHAVAGLSIGCLLGMAVMLFAHPFVAHRYGVSGGRASHILPRREVLSALWRTALPVTLSASVMSLCDMLDSMIVIRRLCGTGMDAAEALRLYGSYTALAVPMFNLPPILIYPLTTALIPVIAAARSQPEKCRRIIAASLSGTVLIALPCTAGMSVMAEPILRLFYRADLAETGAPLLSVLALAVLFLSILAMTNAILQAMGEARYPLYSMLIGAAVKLCASWILTGNAEVGIFGTPISTVLCYAVMALCNLYFVMKKTGVALHICAMLCRPAISAVFCALTARAAHAVLLGHMPEVLGTLVSVVLGGVTYLAALLALGGIGEDVLSLLTAKLRHRRAAVVQK
ncbi:MAG: polysaccharide biosynthesis protein [Ruminococcaceae bacterium]|nr:polysaccharide biosynthesis protein [Oscillospiraceae bacterium]